MKPYLGKAYYEHEVFIFLNELEEFYDFLSLNNFCTSTLFVKKTTNIDNWIFSSIKGTIESIKCLLNIGRINDAFALIRKYEDAVLTDIYKSLLLKDEEEMLAESFNNKTFYEMYKNKINDWAYAVDKVDLKANEDKIAKDPRVKDLTKILGLKTKAQKKEGLSEGAANSLRQLCNNNVHYNSLKYYIWNDNTFLDTDNSRLTLINNAKIAILNVFIIHFSYTLVLHPEYYTSSDYLDALENGEEPEEGSQHWVAPFVQEIFDKYISQNNKDLTTYLQKCSFLELKSI